MLWLGGCFGFCFLKRLKMYNDVSYTFQQEKINKMSIQNVSIVLSPTMRISHRVLNVLFLHSKELFSHIKITRYVDYVCMCIAVPPQKTIISPDDVTLYISIQH